MSVSSAYCVRVQGGVAEIELHRVPTLSEIRRSLADVIRHAGYRMGTALLFIDHAAVFDPTPDMIGLGVRCMARFARHFDRHVAFVIEKETHYEISRQCAACAESHGLPYWTAHTRRYSGARRARGAAHAT